MEGCPNCGAPIRSGAKFCTTCGFRLSTSDQPMTTAEGAEQPSTFDPVGAQAAAEWSSGSPDPDHWGASNRTSAGSGDRPSDDAISETTSSVESTPDEMPDRANRPQQDREVGTIDSVDPDAAWRAPAGERLWPGWDSAATDSESDTSAVGSDTLAPANEPSASFEPIEDNEVAADEVAPSEHWWTTEASGETATPEYAGTTPLSENMTDELITGDAVVVDSASDSSAATSASSGWESPENAPDDSVDWSESAGDPSPDVTSDESDLGTTAPAEHVSRKDQEVGATTDTGPSLTENLAPFEWNQPTAESTVDASYVDATDTGVVENSLGDSEPGEAIPLGPATGAYADTTTDGAGGDRPTAIIDQVASLIDQLRTLLPTSPGDSRESVVSIDTSAIADDLQAARQSGGAYGDFRELKAVLTGARDRPRDIDVMLQLTGHLDELLALHDAYERCATAIDAATSTLNPSKADDEGA